MSTVPDRFSKGDSFGSMSPAEKTKYLALITDQDPAAIPPAGAGGMGFLTPKKSYEHTGVILGFIPPQVAGGSPLHRVIAINATAGDAGLVNQRVKISLDKFFVNSYPGHGTHTILCEFAGKNQVDGDSAEELRFALQFKVGDNASAGISGAPIFLGLTVGADGISFEARCVNVSSSHDDAVLAALEDQAFKNGLSLLTTAQPALKPLTALAAAAVKAVANRSKNKQVHNFKLGLDFNEGASSARLRLGSYVVVQTDNMAGWDWEQFEWNQATFSLQRKTVPNVSLDFNYMVFGVASFSGVHGT